MRTGNKASTKFWLNRWQFDNALVSNYYHLFALCVNSHITFFEIVMSRDQALTFTRYLTGVLLVDLNAIYNIIAHYQLS
jgi:hypothetical protein